MLSQLNGTTASEPPADDSMKSDDLLNSDRMSATREALCSKPAMYRKISTTERPFRIYV